MENHEIIAKPVITEAVYDLIEIENKIVRESLLHALTGFEFVGETDG